LQRNQIADMGQTTKTFKDIDKGILKALPNPASAAYEIKIKVPEMTFLGVSGQPDFGTIYLTVYPKKHVIELKAMKQYIYQLRDVVVSYERLINIVYDHLMEVYKPERMRIVMICNPRGGISSKLTIDSDWKVRGGKEKFKDWIRGEDEWEVLM
jgi:7-cyano-7-deazaguanine reductase